MPMKCSALTICWLLIFSSQQILIAQATKKIEIEHANTMEFDKSMGPDVKRLLGNVVFRHENSIMYCDSAWYYSAENRVDAFGHIHVRQGDTVHLYGDYMRYLGEKKIAEVRKNVRLIDKETILNTENLDFNIQDSYGYYFNGGTINSGENTLKSKYGYYYSREKLFFYKGNVELHNPDYTIFCDTLKYQTVQKIAYFLGPTRIISDENLIYCENGWYNTEKKISQFNKHAYLKNKNQVMHGDSLYYERENGFGEAFKNVELFDSAENVILKGEYAYYHEEPEKALLTGRALMIKVTDSDSIFIHADTLRSVTDSSGQHKIMKAYYHMKFYETDLQAKCDSLAYSLADSVIRLYGEPVLWSDENQLSAEYIAIYTRNRDIDRLEMTNTAFIISQEDSDRYNQVKGKTMTGFFANGELSRIEVIGNGQTIYFPKDENELIGVNKAESTNLTIYLKERKVDRIIFRVQPAATLSPLQDVTGNDLYLKDFRWFNKYRPKEREDIYQWVDEE
jgi:lipopolysaccharide export system protein LptA